MNKRFSSVPRQKCSQSIQFSTKLTNKQSILHTPRRFITEQDQNEHSSQLCYTDRWKPEKIKTYVKHKILDKGLNFKSNTKEIFIIHNCFVYKYYVPQYNSILNEKELISDFIEIQLHLKELLGLKNMPKLWTLDGQLVKNFSLLIQQIIYINYNFDFWETIQSYHEFKGRFQISKISLFFEEIANLDTLELVQQYFFSSKKLSKYFTDSNLKFPIIKHNDKQIEFEDHDIDSLFLMLNKDKQKQKVQLYDKLNREENNNTTSQNKSSRLIRFPLKINTRNSIEKSIINSDIMNFQELQKQIEFQVQQQNLFIPQIDKEIFDKKNITEQQNYNFSDPLFLQKINIDKIQFKYKINRRQTINFLTIFKCLIDKETKNKKQKITKENLLLAYPYLILEGQKCEFETYQKIKENKQQVYNFEEFVTIFTKGNN